MSYDPRTTVFPSEIPQDPKHLAQLAEQQRLAEVEGLRREREQVIAHRETVAEAKPESEMVVVDAEGRDTRMRVRRVTAGLARERHDDLLRDLDESLAAIDRELAHRGVTREVNGMPKVKGNIKPPKPKK